MITFFGSDPRAGFSPPSIGPFGRYGRMFPHLEPLLPDDQTIQSLAATMIEPQGKTLGDNPRILAGYTYLGQFIDHDLSFDTTSLGETVRDAAAIINYRTPRLDLDSVYGSGPLGQPWLFTAWDPSQFQLGSTQPVEEPHPIYSRQPSSAFDLLRRFDGKALIPDPRNDENLLVAQIHLAFQRAHNRVVQESPPAWSQEQKFTTARKRICWHYQWIVVREYLPLVTGIPAEQALSTAGRVLRFTGEPFIPVEFSAGVFRFGHSMIRDHYAVNATFPNAPLRALMNVTGFQGTSANAPIQENWRPDWPRFFPFPRAGAPGNPSRRINTFYSQSLTHAGLAGRDLARGKQFSLPAGEDVAAFLGEQPLESPTGPTPLLYYILREASVRTGGEHLGPVGGRIVSEVILAILRSDPNSFLAQQPGWKPDLGSRPGEFTMADLLHFAGVA